jgi:hypothetical protein
MEDFPACGPLSFLPMPKGQGYPERTFDDRQTDSTGRKRCSIHDCSYQSPISYQLDRAVKQERYNMAFLDKYTKGIGVPRQRRQEIVTNKRGY